MLYVCYTFSRCFGIVHKFHGVIIRVICVLYIVYIYAYVHIYTIHVHKSPSSPPRDLPHRSAGFGTAADLQDAAAQSCSAGMDQELCNPTDGRGQAFPHLAAAVTCRHTRHTEGGLVRWHVRTRGQGKAQCKARAAGAARWRGRGA